MISISTSLPILASLLSLASANPIAKRATNVYISPTSNPSQCLNAASLSNNAAVTLGACSSSSTKWDISGGNNLGLKVSGSNFCLDSTTQFPGNYQSLKIYTCYNNIPQQTFWYTDDLHIAITGGRACLDSGNGGQYWDCIGYNTNQIWTTSSTAPGGGSGGGGTGGGGTGGGGGTTTPGAATVVSNCVNSGQIALTFDDGPSGSLEQTVSNNMNGQKATFFLNGNNYQCIYDRADEIIALHNAGHTLGSHTWSHIDITQESSAQLNTELERVEVAFQKILGLTPRYFRPPYGSYNQAALDVLKARGYAKVFLWTDDSGDSTGSTVAQSEQVYDQIATTFPSPHIVLNHSPDSTTANQLVPYAVSKLNAAGYSLVSVDTCLGSQGEWPYTYYGPPGTRDSSWVC